MLTPQKLKQLIKKAKNDPNEFLDLSGYGLKTLPEIPEGVFNLDCSNNQLEDLPELPGSLLELNCSNNQFKKLPNLSYLINLEIIDFSNNQLTEVPKVFSSVYKINLDGNLFTKIPKIPHNVTYCLLNNPISNSLYNVREFDSQNIKTHSFNKLKFKSLILRKGTVIFKMIKTAKSLFDSFVGYQVGSNYVMGPTVESYFFLQPFNTGQGYIGYGQMTLMFVLNYDVEVILGLEPGNLTKSEIIKNFGEPCVDKKYQSEVDYRYWWGQCISDVFEKNYSGISGWIATGDDERSCKHPEGENFEKYKDYVSFYKTHRHISRPELAIHPRHARTTKDIKVPVKNFSPEWIIEHEKEFNYKIIDMIEDNTNFKNYKRVMDVYLSEKGCKNLHIFRGDDGLYMCREYM